MVWTKEEQQRQNLKQLMQLLWAGSNVNWLIASEQCRPTSSNTGRNWMQLATMYLSRQLQMATRKKAGAEKPIFPAVSDLEFANSRAATKHINSQDNTSPMNSEQLKTSRRRIANTRE